MLTASRTASGTLALHLWSLAGDAIAPAPLAAASAGATSAVEVVSLRKGARVVTAVRQADGQLKVIAWDVAQPEGGPWAITRLGDASEGVVSEVALSTTGNDDHVAWQPSQDERTRAVRYARNYTQSAGPIDRLAVVRLPAGQPILLTAVRTVQGTLKVIRVLRPLQFRGVPAVHDLSVLPGGAAANPVTVMDGHAAYFDTYVVWP